MPREGPTAGFRRGRPRGCPPLPCRWNSPGLRPPGRPPILPSRMNRADAAGRGDRHRRISAPPGGEGLDRGRSGAGAQRPLPSAKKIIARGGSGNHRSWRDFRCRRWQQARAAARTDECGAEPGRSRRAPSAGDPAACVIWGVDDVRPGRRFLGERCSAVCTALGVRARARQRHATGAPTGHFAGAPRELRPGTLSPDESSCRDPRPSTVVTDKPVPVMTSWGRAGANLYSLRTRRGTHCRRRRKGRGGRRPDAGRWHQRAPADPPVLRGAMRW